MNVLAALLNVQAAPVGPTTPGGVLQWIDFQVGSWAGAIQQALVAWAIRGLAVTVTLMFLWYGYRLLLGIASGTLEEIARKFLVPIVVIVLTINSFFWWPALYGFFTQVPAELADLVLTATGVNSASAKTLLDTIFFDGNNTGMQIITQSGFTNPSGWVVGLMVIIGTFFFTVLMLSMLAMSHIMLGLLLGMAPMMILTLPFESTRSIFEKWLGMLVNYALIPMLTYTVGTLVAAGATIGLAGSLGNASLSTVLPYLLWCFVGFYVLIQVPGIAAALGGGIVMAGATAVAKAPLSLAKQIPWPKKDKDKDKPKKETPSSNGGKTSSQGAKP